METNNYTFWEIISKNQIEIPVIQRDYAQGRKNERVEAIRNRFLEALIKTITTENCMPLHLDFVYGRIFGKEKEVIRKRNMEAIERVLEAVQGYASNLEMDLSYDVKQLEQNTFVNNTKLQPLDGQQRLTTLFLLHWYLIQRIHENKEARLKLLQGFQYKTRKTTSEFCDFITTNDYLKELDFENIEDISEYISNNNSFYKYWKNDPSVKGMLVVLQSIHSNLKTFTKEDVQLMFNRLLEERRITFDFLDLDQLEQTDELYVKMNARGKQLSDFEHFKAWLQDKYKLDKQSWDKLDTDWLNHFWINKDSNVFDVDSTIYDFVKNINLFQYIVNTPESEIDLVIVDRIRQTDEKKKYIPLSLFEKDKHGFFTLDTLKFLFRTFDSIYDDIVKIWDIELGEIYCYPFKQRTYPLLSNFFITSYNNFNYWDRVYYFSYLLYLENNNGLEDSDIESLKSWMRICRNIIFNTYIHNPSTFIKAVKSIHSFANQVFKINNVSIEEGIKTDKYVIPFFDTQLEEEKLKLIFCDKGEDWKSTIIELENHEYFYGQINFLFELTAEEPDNFEKFSDYAGIASKLFSDIESNDFLFHRALLSQGDYLVNSGNKFSFCVSDIGSLRSRNDNWRKVYNREDKRFSLKSLIDKIINGEKLEDIVNSELENDKWRKYFIKFPQTIKYSSDRLIDFVSEMDIKLLKGATYNGKHTDLYLYVLFLQLEACNLNNLTIIHEDVNNYRSKDNYPNIRVFSSSKDKYYFSISYQMYGNNEFGFETQFEGNIDSISSEFINGMDIVNENVFSYKFTNEEGMELALNSMIEKLSQFNIIFELNEQQYR